MSFAELHERVIRPGLCARCGICAGVCPGGVIGFNERNFPVLSGDCTDCGLCTRCCPGAEVALPHLARRLFDAGYDPGSPQGHVDRMFVAHSTVASIRDVATSGGVVTGLLVHLLEQEVIDGAVVVGRDPEKPYGFKGILATTAGEILGGAQSKYCLTPSMAALSLIRKRKGRFAVAGLPCQVQGLRKLSEADPALAGKIYCVFGLYCHCNMEPYAHLEVMKACGIRREEVAGFEFRGGGWPGGFLVTGRGGEKIPLHSTTYTTVLNVLFKLYGADRCYLCIDALSEFADLSFGDFWAGDYTGELARHERCTLVSQRTPRGREILLEAEKHGAIAMYSLPPQRRSRRIDKMALGKKNGNLAWMAVRVRNGLPVPDYGFPLPPLSGPGRRSVLKRRLFFLLRGPRLRRLIVRLLFSPAGMVFERCNNFRKRMLDNYHGN